MAAFAHSFSSVSIIEIMSVWHKYKSRFIIGGVIIFTAFIVTGLANISIPQSRLTVVFPTPTTISPIVVKPVSAKCLVKQVNMADSQAIEPDAACTPGIVNPAVTQATIYQTICISDYVSTIRPSTSYTESVKFQSIKDYGYTDTNVRNYEEDYLIPLELGGSPTNLKNLWAEPHATPNEKDTVENYLHAQVCAGRMNLAEAQKEISTDWYSVFKSARL